MEPRTTRRALPRFWVPPRRSHSCREPRARSCSSRPPPKRAACLAAKPTCSDRSCHSGKPPRCSISTSRTSGERSEEHTSELQSPCNLVCRLLLEKKKKQSNRSHTC